MFSDFPSLHPLIVHFPIVLIIISVIFQIVVVWKDWETIRWVTLFIMGGAFLSALAASTIFHAEPTNDAPKAAMEIFEQHELYAQYTLWLSGITLALKAIGDFYKINRRSYHFLVLIFAFFSSLFLSITGHYGARLTHIEGIGPMGRYLMKEHGSSAIDMEKMKDTTMKMNDTMSEMQKMSKEDSINNMKEMKMENMPEMGSKKSMGIMDSTSNMKMEKMSEMGSMKNMEIMDSTSNTKKMDNMKQTGMKQRSISKMQDMDDMRGMDSTSNMKDMSKMKSMNMSNPMDTFKFEDNNPRLKENKK